MSNFKSETSFEFLAKNYTRHIFWILCKIEKRSRKANYCVKKMFSVSFLHIVISYYVAIAGTLEHLIIEHVHTSLTS